MPSSLIHSLPRLRVIITTGRRTANLDVDAALGAGVTVINAPLVYDESAAHAVAELAIGLLLSLARKIDAGSRSISAGRWQQSPGWSLRGRSLGLLGLGRISSAMVPIARAFGMDVLAWSPHLDRARAAAAGVGMLPRNQLLSTVDMLSLHMPATADTIGSIGRSEFALMKRDILLINTARADLIVESDLIRALVNGRIAGAALDVFPSEPLPSDSPLHAAPNLLMTPHLGYATTSGLTAFYQAIIAALLRIL